MNCIVPYITYFWQLYRNSIRNSMSETVYSIVSGNCFRLCDYRTVNTILLRMCHNCTIEQVPFIPHLGWSIWLLKKPRSSLLKNLKPNIVSFIWFFWTPAFHRLSTWIALKYLDLETEVVHYLLHPTTFLSCIECFMLRKSIAIHKFPKSESLESSQTALILTPTLHQILLIYFSEIALSIYPLAFIILLWY